MKKQITILSIIACLCLLVGTTFSWLLYQTRAASLAKIHPATLITIQGPGETALKSIDLSYDEDEVDENHIVTIKRPIVIKSESKYFDLCIAHTSNVSQLTIKLYNATANIEPESAYLAGIDANGKPYYWNKSSEENLFLEQYYINYDYDGEKAVADKSIHGLIFPNYNNVQKNAEPLYWVKKRIESSSTSEPFYTNYILELSWREDEKETDILYLIARTSN